MIDLFSTEQTFYKCVEVTARNALFHVCVENDNVATQIIRHIQQDDLRGRLTFIPFNQINRQATTTYPESSDILPMINKLQFDARYRPAVQQIFGDTVIARDLTVASNMALQHNLNAITLHGDQIDKNGGITGGMMSDRHGNKIGNYMSVKKLRDELNVYNTQKSELEEEIKQSDAALHQIEKRIGALVHRRSVDKDAMIDAHKQIIFAQAQLKALHAELNDMDTALANLNENKTALQLQLQYCRDEVASDFTSDLSAEETAELTEKIDQQATLRARLVKLHSATVQAELERNKFDSQLNENLLKQKLDLERELEQLEHDQSQAFVVDKDADRLQEYSAQIKEIEAHVKAINKDLKSKNQELNTLNDKYEQFKQTEADIKSQLSSINSNLDSLLNKKLLYQRKRDECMKKIRELGTISIDLLNANKSKDNRRMIAELEKCNSALMKLKHINKKAANQYSLFYDQKSTLTDGKLSWRMDGQLFCG